MNFVNIKNTLLTGAVSLLAFNATSANADGYYNNYGSSYCDPCNPCPQVACPCPCDSNFYVGAEALFWKAENKDQNYGAVTVTEVVDLIDITTIELQSANHDWNVGFRVFAGYKVDDCCDWELYLAYTRFTSDASGSFVSPITIVGVDTFSAAVSFNNDLKYQTFDALVAKEFEVNQCGYIRPFFGFRGLW
ncbi:MAG: Lpg1974 family pore-forming outer membrane protein, partial [Waddliaceae bacterium]